MDIFNDNPKFEFPEEEFPVEPPEDSILPIIELVILSPLEVEYFTSNYEGDPLGQLEDLWVAEVELRVAEIE